MAIKKIAALSLLLSVLTQPTYANEMLDVSENTFSKATDLSVLAKQASLNRDYVVSAEALQKALLLLENKKDISGVTLRANLFCRLGKVYIEQGQWPAAESSLLECLQIAESLGQVILSGSALADLGLNSFKQGHFENAEEYLNKAIIISSAISDYSTIAFSHLWLGAISAINKDFHVAEVELLKATSIANQANDFSTEGRARNILGENARLNGKYNEAISHYQEALSIYQSINQKFGMTMVIHNLGHVSTMIGDTDSALKYYDKSLRMAIEIQAIPAALEILAALAGIAADKGNYEHALNLLGFVFANPSAPKEALHMFAEPLLIRLQDKLSAKEVETGLARGRSLDFDKVVESLLHVEKQGNN